jgi:hypothetical protein
MNLFFTNSLVQAGLLGMLVFFSCKPAEKSSLVLYSNENKVDITVRSSCKISSISPLQNEAELKNKIAKSGEESIRKLKLKINGSLAKSNYRISKTELVITERCGVRTSSGKPFVGLQQILILENIESKKLIEFRADTILADQQSLEQPNTLVPQKIILDTYIPGLTEKNYRQVKAQFQVK